MQTIIMFVILVPVALLVANLITNTFGAYRSRLVMKKAAGLGAEQEQKILQSAQVIRHRCGLPARTRNVVVPTGPGVLSLRQHTGIGMQDSFVRLIRERTEDLPFCLRRIDQHG